MKTNYKITNFLDRHKIYNTDFRYMYCLKLYVIDDLHLYSFKQKKEMIVSANQIIELDCLQYQTNYEKGLYTLQKYPSKYFVSKEELNAKTIPMYIKKASYLEDYSSELEGIEIRKNKSLFPIYRTPKLENDAKNFHYIFVDSVLKKMFLNCGEIVLNSHMNMILKNVKQFDKLFIKTNNAKLLIEIKEYLEIAYNKMLETETEIKKIKTAREYFELDFSDLNENEFLEELRIKKEFLKNCM